MSYFSNIDNTLKSMSILFMFGIVMLCNVSVFGQEKEKKIVISNTTEIASDAKEESTSSSNMDFVLWFMGSKQDPNSTISTEGSNTKKKIMTTGLAPNRILIKAFLKKAVNFESALS
ncbi:hypothetical protein [Flavobacterium sp. W22_SRS_FP1]|uniref:hypothetical protein n=1 Tax=Flavobacterium sp. W22_SRS_FP1 TaxID=3240276 RepID=UPI003F906FC8